VIALTSLSTVPRRGKQSLFAVDLWEHQKRAVELITERFRGPTGATSLLAVAPVGSGKGTLAAYLLARCQARGNLGLFVVHRREIVLDQAKRLTQLGVDVGVLLPGHRRRNATVQVASTGTVLGMVRRKEIPDAFDPAFVVWDEAHHCVAPTYRQIRDALPKAKHLGLTASWERQDGTALGDCFEDLTEVASVQSLMQQGFLSGYTTIGPKIYLGDQIAEHPVEQYLAHCPGESAVAFCKSTQEAHELAQEFRDHKVSAACITGETPTAIRDRVLMLYQRREIKVITNFNVLTEGWDAPHTSAVIVTRPAESLVYQTQTIGRGLRAHKDKQICKILDLVGNQNVWGPPDLYRTPTLEGRVKKEGVQGDGITKCPSCKEAIPEGVSLAFGEDGCPSCHYTRPEPVLRLPIAGCGVQVLGSSVTP
jgi:superfamily II DNA or RNA helicase